MHMQFKEMEEHMIRNAERYREDFGVDWFQGDFITTKLLEECGELAQAILIHEKKCRPEKHTMEDNSKAEVAKELADVVGIAAILARTYDIDLEQAIENKWINKGNG